MAAVKTDVCRLCSSRVPSNRRISFFSPTGLRERWASRVSRLLVVTVDCNDGLPGFMCEICKRRLNSLEKSAEDLENFREQAKRSRELFSSRETLKRSKETSSDFVSPDTRKEKPPSKRISVPVGRRLDFGVQSSSSQGEFKNKVCEA